MKKWLLVGMALVIALSGVLAGCACEKEEGETAGTIRVPDGPRIRVVFSGPPELEVEWEKMGMVGFQVHLVGTLKNISNQTVTFSEIAYLFDGYQVAFTDGPSAYGQTLAAGEEMRFGKGFPGFSENTKVLEVKIKGFKKVGDSVITPTPEPTEPEPADSESTEPEPAEPEMTPEEVIMTWFRLLKEGKFSEVIQLYTPEEQERLRSLGGIEMMKEEWEKNPGVSIEIIEVVRLDYPDRKEAKVYYMAYLVDGTVVGSRTIGSGDAHFNLRTIDGEWKIE